MKILIPITGFGKAGGFRVLSELANHWVKSRNQVSFLVDARSPKPYFPTTASIMAYDRNGILKAGNEKILGQSRFEKSGNAYSMYIGMWRALKQIGSEYDVILANHSLTAFPVALSRAKARKFYYVQAYEPEYYSLTSGLKGRLLEFLSGLSYRLSLEQVANAPIYINYKQISAKDWIPPGIDKELFFRRSEQPRFASGKPYKIGVIGRHEPAKGTQYVLAAFRSLAEIDPDVELKVAFGNLPAGWTHPRAEVIKIQGDGELAKFYREIDILVAPGTVQLGACHYPVLEAMSCGTPVITTGYLPANEANAFIVPIHDSTAIEKAIFKIKSMDPYKLAVKLNNASCDVKSFGWKEVSNKFVRVMGCR